jgi:hypothetical protein
MSHEEALLSLAARGREVARTTALAGLAVLGLQVQYDPVLFESVFARLVAQAFDEAFDDAAEAYGGALPELAEVLFRLRMQHAGLDAVREMAGLCD